MDRFPVFDGGDKDSMAGKANVGGQSFCELAAF